MEAKTLSILEHTHLTEMQKDLNRKLTESTKADLSGKGDQLRRSVLHLVVAEAYDGAKTRLTDYVAAKVAFPAFQERVQRYIRHCAELIHAIQTKRNFPGLATLSLSRQQEIHEKVMEHFEELKQHLRLIEQIERDHKLVDVRSTVWILRSLSVTTFMVAGAAFAHDLHAGVLSSLIYTLNEWIERITTYVVGKIL